MTCHPSRVARGHRIERDRPELMVDEYYAARGRSPAGRLPAERQHERDELGRVL